MTLQTRIQRAVQAFRRNPFDEKKLSVDLDRMIVEKQLATGELTEDNLTEKQRQSRLDIRNNDNDLAYSIPTYAILREWVLRANSKQAYYKTEPSKLDPGRDDFLATVWQDEPILAGAIYSMTAKMVSLGWTVTGKRKNAVEAAKLLARAAHMGGYDWGGFISATAEDFYTTNRGVFWELAKNGDPMFAPMIDVGHIDALQCTLTGNSKFPVVYNGYHNGQTIRFQPGEYIHYCSLQSPRERLLGAGFCAVDRAFRAAKLLMSLHDYDDEKINNLPPEGLAAVSGMTMEEFQSAIALWKAKREQDKSLTFPQVLWLIGSDPSAKIGVDFQGFSQMPESFDRKTVIEQYINTLSLAMGVDSREFWTYSGGGLGSAGESEIQHLKAKGKGPGEFISNTERHINGELPEDSDFHFDTQDIEEDANSAAVAKAWIDAYFVLYNLAPADKAPIGAKGGQTADVTNAVTNKANPNPDKPNGQPKLPKPMLPGVDTGGALSSLQGGQKQQAEQVLDRDQFMRLLADKGVLPAWMINDNRILVQDTDIHNQGFKSYGHPEDEICITWKNGILQETRVPGTINLTSKQQQPDVDNIPMAEVLTVGDTGDRKFNASVDSFEKAYDFIIKKRQEILETERNIHGEPIPEVESLRGSKPNRKTIHDEMELWRNHPVLSKYAMTLEEENAAFGYYVAA